MQLRHEMRNQQSRERPPVTGGRSRFFVGSVARSAGTVARSRTQRWFFSHLGGFFGRLLLRDGVPSESPCSGMSRSSTTVSSSRNVTAAFRFPLQLAGADEVLELRGGHLRRR